MTILWHSVKYPPKKDGTYYYRTTCRFCSHDLRKRSQQYYDITTLSYTTDGGWNSHKDYDGITHASGYAVDEDDMWAEVEYVAD